MIDIHVCLRQYVTVLARNLDWDLPSVSCNRQSKVSILAQNPLRNLRLVLLQYLVVGRNKYTDKKSVP